MSRINYIPFARQQQVTVPAATDGRPGRGFTRLADLRVGACNRAHILDAIVWQSSGEGYEGNFGYMLKMRYGIAGKNYFTENLYDIRAFQSGHMPMHSCWTFSRDPKLGGMRYPYRIYPGQDVRVTVIYRSGQTGTTNRIIPAATFNAAKTRGGSAYQLQTVLATPPQGDPLGLLPFRPIVQPPDLILQCPQDSPIDLYSVTFGDWKANISRAVAILDANQNPWWPSPRFERILDPLVAPIELGGYEWMLEPDQVMTFEFENPVAAAQVVDVTIRGVREVEDPNG